METFAKISDNIIIELYLEALSSIMTEGYGDHNDEILSPVTNDYCDRCNITTMSEGYDIEEHQTENQPLPSLHEVKEKGAVEG